MRERLLEAIGQRRFVAFSPRVMTERDPDPDAPRWKRTCLDVLSWVVFLLEVPAGHELVQLWYAIDWRAINLLGASEYHDAHGGRPAWAPAQLVAMLTLMFWYGVAHETTLVAWMQENIVWCWFCGFGLFGPFPKHDALYESRDRLGVEKFEAPSTLAVYACREAGLDQLRHQVEKVTVKRLKPQVVQIGVRSFVCAPGRTDGFACEYLYTIYGSGDVLVDIHVLPSRNLPPLPRVGVRMTLPGGYESFTWYGRGPHETYADRKMGARVGVYSGTVDDQYVPYITPQENGNKTDVRWVSLTNERGIGLLAVGHTTDGNSPLLEVSAHHFAVEDLTAARHTHELKRREEIALNLDYRQSGLGGASCGPGTLPQYLIEPEAMHFGLRLKPFSLEQASPMRLSKQEIESL